MEITLDKPRKFDINFGAIVRFEESAGKPFFESVQGGLLMADLARLLWAAQKELTYDEMIECIPLEDVTDIASAIGREIEVKFASKKKKVKVKARPLVSNGVKR